MNLIKKYWYLILIAILLLTLVLAYIFILPVRMFTLFAWAFARVYISTYPIVFFIIGAVVIFFVFKLARKKDFAQKQIESKIWIRRHVRQFVVVTIAIFGLGFSGVKIIERSKSELFNQLVEIMHSNIPYSNTSYNKDITELICPLVTPEKLQEMMQDKYAKKRTKYLDYPYTYSGREGDVRWEITLEILTGIPIPSELILVIIINQNDGECRARIHQYIFGT